MPEPMTKQRFREGRHKLALSASACAKVFGVSDGRTIRRWEKEGDVDLPGTAGVLMAILAFDEWPDLPE